MKLKTIAGTLLNEASSPADLRAALNAFAQLCSGVGGVVPDPSFNAWADDSLLKDGVAISPEAAAHCVSDTQRTVVFIRAAYAAITAAKQRFTAGPIEILYAGCGPFATLLLPLLTKLNPGELVVHLLDALLWGVLTVFVVGVVIVVIRFVPHSLGVSARQDMPHGLPAAMVVLLRPWLPSFRLPSRLPVANEMIVMNHLHFMVQICQNFVVFCHFFKNIQPGFF